MISVRGSREFRGGPISLVALSKLESRAFPVSVRELATLDSNSISGNVKAGDVSCEYSVTLHNTGNWDITARLRNHGTVAGDYYQLDFVFDEEQGIGASYSGKLAARERRVVGSKGNDQWIRKNWRQLKRAGITGKLKTTPNYSEIVGTYLLGLSVGAAVIFFSSGDRRAQPCPDHSAGKPCVEFQ